MALFSTGESETFPDLMRSILAQFKYSYQVCKWDKQGVPFQQCMYVPEVHPQTSTSFHEREDEAHVFESMYTLYKFI